MTQQTEKNGPRDEPRSVGYATKLAMAALVFAALSAGVALCINYVHYQTWAFVPPAGFGPFHRASGVHDASIARRTGAQPWPRALPASLRPLVHRRRSAPPRT